MGEGQVRDRASVIRAFCGEQLRAARPQSIGPRYRADPSTTDTARRIAASNSFKAVDMLV